MNDATLLELEALKTEREGLIAENLHRQSVGESMAYGDEAFDAVASRIRALAATPEPTHPPELPDELKAMPSHDWKRKLEESAAAVKDGPAWQHAGITLNPEHFETYPAADIDDTHGAILPRPWEKKREAELDATCARDAVDIVRPPGHPLGQRRECWLIASATSEVYYSQRPEWPGMAAMGWTEHHLVELRDWEQIVTREQAAQYAGYRYVAPGDVVLSKEQAGRIVQWLEFARGEGAPIDPDDLRALGMETTT